MEFRKKTIATLLIAIFMISAFAMAMPINAVTPLKFELADTGDGLAEWVEYDGDYCVHLVAPGKCDWSLPEPGFAEADIQIDLSGKGLKLNDLESMSWLFYLVNGYPPALRIKLAPVDGIVYHLVGEFSYQEWDESGFVYTGTPWVPYTHYDTGLEKTNSFYYPTYNEWMSTFHTTAAVSDRPDDTVTTSVHDDTIFWVCVVGGIYGVDWCSCPQTGYPAEASYFATLDDYKITEVQNIKGDRQLPILGDVEIVMLEFAVTNEIGPLVDPPGHEVYVDDIEINGVIYDLEPSSSASIKNVVRDPVISITVSPTDVDFGTLIRGQTSDPVTFTVTNIGEANVDISAQMYHMDMTPEVQGDFYYDNLNLGGGQVHLFGESNVVIGLSITPQLTLIVPQTAVPGTYEGILVFWATGP